MSAVPTNKPKKPSEITLREWAAARGVHYRTAQRWAQGGKLTTARKVTIKTVVPVTRLQKTYVIPKATKIPS